MAEFTTKSRCKYIMKRVNIGEQCRGNAIFDGYCNICLRRMKYIERQCRGIRYSSGFLHPYQCPSMPWHSSYCSECENTEVAQAELATRCRVTYAGGYRCVNKASKGEFCSRCYDTNVELPQDKLNEETNRDDTLDSLPDDH